MVTLCNVPTNTQYRILSVIWHAGPTPNAGHYTSRLIIAPPGHHSTDQWSTDDARPANAPHGSAILVDFDEDQSTKFRGCLEAERDFEDTNMIKTSKMSRAGARFLNVYKVRQARNVEDVLRGSAILFKGEAL